MKAKGVTGRPRYPRTVLGRGSRRAGYCPPSPLGAPPSTSAYDCESGNIDNSESCSFPESQAGTWYVLVYADKNYSGASLVASYTETAIFSDGFESGDTTAWSDRQP
ncbi:MAG: hypothetical protein GY842_09955 [bacterium]|nr:hypothetical protein [bacterium]